MAADATPEPERDELYHSMNEWQLSMANTAMGNGLSRDAAMGLASSMRWELEVGLRKPRPLIVITCL